MPRVATACSRWVRSKRASWGRAGEPRSVALAVLIAVFDLTHIDGALTVRQAAGSEHYLAFNETEQPEPGEVIFADNAGEAHARRWTNRQSARSAIRETSSDALIVAEALYDDAHDSLSMLLTMLTTAIRETWGSHIEGELIFESERQSMPGTPHRLLEYESVHVRTDTGDGATID
ncbi:phenylalanine--tRNA ligase beta subunit-related protein [Gulosibacter molinativorax]|uniref:phenylalanine--tRNA ligase beta subunit-related protein n=1 Tax=Gulosibacter molinativorax TaxID=256821 RepID=UPI001B7FBFE8|nr:phenylalanine--tRNA ligase beta subunit-related protein [Gulosibacter molinativorax]